LPEKIVTGSFDWYEPAEAGAPANWDPAGGGSLQEARLRELFADYRSLRTILNVTDLFVVEDLDVDNYGGLTIKLTDRFRLRVFPTGSRGEFWRIFRKGDLGSHCVCGVDEAVS
jgi:hypothetical protein